jgi:hypothetical protein
MSHEEDEQLLICPVCIANATVIMDGVFSAGGLTAFAIKTLLQKRKMAERICTRSVFGGTEAHHSQPRQ